MDKYTLREKIDIKTGLQNYPELLKSLLMARGVDTEEKAEVFLNPDYENHLHDPFLLKDMEKAVERILRAIDSGEKILIYSDYDADGIPGGAILHDFFEKIQYKNFENYIPHRHDEGYGLNTDAIDEFGKSEVKLLITVDCGIVDKKEVSHANSFGIDVIVTDHHLPNGSVPEAYAILNPKQADCSYPYDMLCGSGVVFKLIQAILQKRDFGIKAGQEKWFLDLVGLATLSDMVPLNGENRVFAHYGLKVLRRSPRLGLMKLLRKLKINQKYILEDDIGFMLAPRINAASRMGIPMDAFKLLTTTDEVEADLLSDHLNKINDERKGVVASIVKDIKKHLKSKNLEDMSSVLVMGNPDWRPGVLGLAANKLVEEYSRPVFLWGREGGSDLKGSCRSDGTINLVELMETVKDQFIAFGGHALSGGFSVLNEKIHTLSDVLSKAYEKIQSTSGEKAEKEKIWIDGKLFLDQVNWDTYKTIEKLAPYGVGNPKPTFLFENIKISGVKMFGKDKNHLELSFLDKNNNKKTAMGFFMKSDSFGEELKEGDSINLVATIEKSMFRNFPELRLRIVDVILV
ncbi:MAG: single-stranded-DNA-specific exonuclease RecJ [Parcubacteria group bacterium]|nr:single-stranded-DNA-specific exonuclease RecJ [Parcubacteria group bacterium]